MSRAGEAFSWRGEGNPATHDDGYSNIHQHQKRQVAGGRAEGSGEAGGGKSSAWGDGGAGGQRPAGQPKVGVLDRLGLVSEPFVERRDRADQ